MSVAPTTQAALRPSICSRTSAWLVHDVLADGGRRTSVPASAAMRNASGGIIAGSDLSPARVTRVAVTASTTRVAPVHTPTDSATTASATATATRISVAPVTTRPPGSRRERPGGSG